MIFATDLQYISSFFGIKLFEPIVFWQTQQQKQLSCHCLPLYSIFLDPKRERNRATSEKYEQVRLFWPYIFSHLTSCFDVVSQNLPERNGFLQPSQRAAKVTL